MFQLFERFTVVFNLKFYTGLAGFGDLAFEVFDSLDLLFVLFFQLDDFLLQLMKTRFGVFQVLGLVGICVGTEQIVVLASHYALFVAFGTKA